MKYITAMKIHHPQDAPRNFANFANANMSWFCRRKLIVSWHEENFFDAQLSPETINMEVFFQAKSKTKLEVMEVQ